MNYARKNLRFYFQKTAPGETVSLSYGEIDGNGNQSNPITTEGKKIFSNCVKILSVRNWRARSAISPIRP